MKKPVKWLGGKTWLANKTQALINDIRPNRVIEPFAGSGAFSFYHEFESVLLNDTNPALINFYQRMAAGYEIDPSQYVLDKAFYEEVKAELNDALVNGRKLGEKEAGDFWFLCMHSFNGLVRQSKKKGTFNMPMGKYNCIATPPDSKTFQAVTRNWSFKCGCFSATQAELSDAQVVIIDPPYEDFDKKRKVFRGYTGDTNENLQSRIMHSLSDFDGVVIATNHLTPGLINLYRDNKFSIFTTMVKRSVSCKANGRVKVPEMIAFRGLSKNQLRLLSDNFEIFENAHE